LTLFGVSALEERLAQRLSLPAGARDLPDRQRTLRAAIDWSYRLLSPIEQALFRVLSVFAGGARLEAIESVLEDSASDPVEIVMALVEKSLLRRHDDRDGQPRFWMLETIRQYAVERAAGEGENGSIAERHALYFAEFADQAKPHLRTAEQSVWLARLEADDHNLRIALDHLTATEPSRALRMAAALGRFWEIRRRHTEGRERLRRVLQFSSSDYAAAANATNSAGRLAFLQGDAHAAELLFVEALRLARVAHEPLAEVLALGILGSCAERRGEVARSLELYEEALAAARQAHDDQSLAVALGNLGFAVTNLGETTGESAEIKRGEALLEEALFLCRRLGDTMNTAAMAGDLAECALASGDLDRAEALIAETLLSAREIHHRSEIGWAVGLEALLALKRADADAAHARFVEALELIRGDYDIQIAHFAISVAAAIAAARGESLLAAALWGALDEMRTRDNPEPFTVTRLREEWLPIARRGVDTRAWDAAWAAGLKLRPEQALEVAAIM
jgi:tetratricopeptide (TPR) repeat protein